MNGLGALLCTFGKLEQPGIEGLALLVGIIFLLPGSIPVILEIGPLGRFFDFLGVYLDHVACALVAVLINLVFWRVVGAFVRHLRPRPAGQ